METSNNNQNNNIKHKKDKENSLIFKIVILGDSGVGKTSLLHYYVFNKCKNYLIKIKRTLNIPLR